MKNIFVFILLFVSLFAFADEQLEGSLERTSLFVESLLDTSDGIVSIMQEDIQIFIDLFNAYDRREITAEEFVDYVAGYVDHLYENTNEFSVYMYNIRTNIEREMILINSILER